MMVLSISAGLSSQIRLGAALIAGLVFELMFAPAAFAQDTSYLYALTVNNSGSVSVKQVETFSPGIISQSRCSQVGLMPTPNQPTGWHLSKSSDWTTAGCQMTGIDDFDTLDAFRAYLRLFHVGAAVEDNCGLTVLISLPIAPPNPITNITVVLKLPGGEPITQGAARTQNDNDELTWTFSKQALQSLQLNIAAESTAYGKMERFDKNMEQYATINSTVLRLMMMSGDASDEADTPDSVDAGIDWASHILGGEIAKKDEKAHLEKCKSDISKRSMLGAK